LGIFSDSYYNAKIIALFKLDDTSKLVEQLITFVADDKDVGVVTETIHKIQEVVSSCIVKRGVEDLIE
jgi:hypothetical protein